MPIGARGGKYDGADMRNVLGSLLTEGPEGMLRNASAPLTYSSPTIQTTVVMTPTSDKDVKGSPMTTTTLFSRFKENPTALSEKEHIIFPIAENQKILWVIPRMHWVTVDYDKINNKATLLDSRPWYASFLYPTKPMEKMLRAGVAQLFGDNKGKEMKFESVYQSVQYNDRCCGAWTAANVGCLASGSTIDEQKRAFTSSNEQGIVSFNNLVVDTDDWKMMEPAKGLFQKLKDFFLNIIKKPGEAIQSRVSSSSYASMAEGALAPSAGSSYTESDHASGALSTTGSTLKTVVPPVKTDVSPDIIGEEGRLEDEEDYRM